MNQETENIESGGGGGGGRTRKWSSAFQFSASYWPTPLRSHWSREPKKRGSEVDTENRTKEGKSRDVE